ncbi:HpcH/HpaI aldolase/citrate lyase family protein [Agrobacterium larrymoorei]|uniref:CoA ester lyase n=1 Tax=Agrobacterium larrymoorei TaxID=160699 RepID=A0A4D7DUD5_9HYPH|nr:CoA ester lyase [Agrobacterium larrymoorei]QCJ01156.1 CoA ester lyase [Agrobacterium larrymoorei]QYA10166.1 CoA ester lyase [Agrobacterium larrymoorei]
MNSDNAPHNVHARDALSYLFVPGNRPDRFEKALASGADRVIVDLEDAVAAGEKDAARSAADRWFRIGNPAVLRINGIDSYWFEADLAMAARFPEAEVMLPKADPASVERVLKYLVDRPVIALIETVSGLMQASELASTRGVSRIAFGNIDFSTDARIHVTSPALDHARFQIAMVSRAAGQPPPIDGVTAALDDEDQLVNDIRNARAYGFGGKLCVHPKQVALVNQLFGPDEKEITWAKAILSAVEAAGDNVVQFEGKMVDRPVVERATQILQQLLR